MQKSDDCYVTFNIRYKNVRYKQNVQKYLLSQTHYISNKFPQYEQILESTQ